PDNKYEPIKYGLTHPLENKNGLYLIFHEFIQIFRDLRIPNLTLKEKLLYIFGKPGYSHDGSRMTSEKLREFEAIQNGAPNLINEKIINHSINKNNPTSFIEENKINYEVEVLE